MIRQLAARKRLAGLSPLSLVFLLASCGLLQPRQALAQDAAPPEPASPAAQDAAPAVPAVSQVLDQWKEELAAWRAAREREIDAPDGSLTLVGMEWLKPGANSVGTAEDNQIRVHAQAPDHIGLLTVSSNQPSGNPPKGKQPDAPPQNSQIVQLLSPPGGFPPDLLVDGKPAREGALTVEGPSLSMISWHGLTMVVLNRGGRYALRIKDADSPARTSFNGLNWYAPDLHFRVRAVWTPFSSPQTEKIPTVLGTTIDLPSPGYAEFVLDGKPLRLQPVLEDPNSKTLFFILSDVTSDIATYGTARYLHTGLPDHGLDQPGLLTLDFNRLENPPCAYSTYATCPMPPEQNRLLVPLQAGEKLYVH